VGWFVVMAAFAAFGLWLILLWWLVTPLPGQAWPILFLFGDTPQEAECTARRYGGIVNFGIRLVIVTAEEYRIRLEKSTKAEIWSPEEYLRYLETERNRIAGTGNGDHPGRDQRCGLSEL